MSNRFSAQAVAADKGLKANEWIQAVSGLLNGKGGGRETSAQASGTNTAGMEEVIALARQFAEARMS